MTYALGVDLGTTWTAAAVRRGTTVTVATLGNRSPEMPSVVYLSESGELLVGEAAERRAASDPSRVAREFKRRMGDPTPILIGGAPWSAQALSARLLRAAIDRVTEREGEAPGSVTVTHPANWGPFKMELLQQTLQLADVPDATTVPEPEAAALHYASAERVAVGDVVAVYDLGGGTFDVAVLRKSAEGFDVLGTPQGVEHLGGVDFDEAVFAHVREALGPALLDVDLDSPAVLAALTRLRRECVDAKEALSVDTVVSVPVAVPPLQTEVRLTRGEFEELIAPAVDETLRALERALQLADVEPQELRTVVLVGGSSRIPLVAERVSAAIGRPIGLDTHPKHSVAAGAALVGGRDQGRQGVISGRTSRGTVPADQTPLLATDVGGTGPGGPSTRPGLGWLPRRRVVPAALVAGVLASAGLAAVLLSGTDRVGEGGEALGGGVPVSEQPLPDDVVLHAETLNDHIDVVRRQAAPGSASSFVAGAIAVEDKLPVLLPGRRSLVYVRAVPGDVGGGAELHIVAADGTGDAVLATQWGADSRPSFHPDGEQVAYERLDATTRQSDIFVARLAVVAGVPTLQDERNLTRDPAPDGDPAWSPDGRRIAFWKRGAGLDLVLYDVETSTSEALTSTPDVDEVDPTWSPDSSGLVYSRQSGPAAARQSELVVQREGEEPRVLFNQAGLFANDAHFSPDGTRIAFQTEQRDAGGFLESVVLWTMAPDGSGAAPFAERTGGGWIGHLAW